MSPASVGKDPSYNAPRAPCRRKDAYLCDITYGTNNEYGFDYLQGQYGR